MKSKLPERIKLEGGAITLHKTRYRPPHKLQGQVNPVWYATIKLGTGVDRKTFSTKEKIKSRAEKVAREEAFKMQALLHQGLSIKPDNFDHIAGRFLASYKEQMKREDRDETYKHRYSIIHNHWIPVFESKSISTISSRDLHVELMKLHDTDSTRTYTVRGEKRVVKTGGKLAKSTISKYMIVLREVFNFALTDGKITTIPQIPKVMSSKRDNFKPRPALTEDEWIRFNSVLKEFEEHMPEKHVVQRFYRRALRDWCQLISYSGLRTGEASLLKWKDWEPRERDGVEYALLHVRGEEKRARKTFDRKVVGLDWINHTLNRRKADTRFTDPDDYIFTHQGGDRAGQPIMSFRRSFDSTLKKASIGFDKDGRKIKGYSPYILRHSMATFALTLRNVDIFYLASNLGNQVSTTERFYSKATAEDFAAHLGKLPEMDEESLIQSFLKHL